MGLLWYYARGCSQGPPQPSDVQFLSRWYKECDRDGGDIQFDRSTTASQWIALPAKQYGRAALCAEAKR